MAYGLGRIRTDERVNQLPLRITNDNDYAHLILPLQDMLRRIYLNPLVYVKGEFSLSLLNLASHQFMPAPKEAFSSLESRSEQHEGPPAKKKMKATAVIETFAVPAHAVPMRGGKRNLRRSWKDNPDRPSFFVEKVCVESIYLTIFVMKEKTD